MSAQLKSFEGPDVQVLLDRIHVELGPGAKISGAERVRVGGLFGFFAKEHYRVVAEAEAPDTAEPEARRPPDGRSETIDEAPLPWSRPTAAGTAEEPAPMAPDAGPVEKPDPVAPAGHDVAGAVASTAARTTDDVIEDSSGPADPTPVTESGNAAPDPFAAPVSRSTTGPGTDRPTEPDLATDDLVETPTDIATGAALFLADNTDGAIRPFCPPGVPAAEPGDALARSLLRAGVGDDMIRRISEDRPPGVDLEARLRAVFSGLPAAPPLPGQAGSLLVVVGEGAPARRLAAALAGEIGVDPTEVPFASLDTGAFVVATGRQLVRSPAEAAERAPGWRRSRAAVVVVDAHVTGGQQSWARHLIVALRPTAVWGIVTSTCKTEDIISWMDGIGGVDALAVDNLDATVSPASVLGTGVPVARMDGHPATAARWAATIVDRITSTSHHP